MGYGQPGKSAFDWEVYRSRKTALQYLRQNNTLVDTILECEDGSAFEPVHSQVVSAFGEKLTKFLNQNGSYIEAYNHSTFANRSDSFWYPSRREDEEMATDFCQPTTSAQNLASASRPSTSSSAPKSSAPSSQHKQQQQQQRPVASPRTEQQEQHQQQPVAAAAAVCPTAEGEPTTPAPEEPIGRQWYRRPGKIKLVRLPRVSKYTLAILVECAYTGYIRTDLPSGGIWQVLEVADHYEMVEVIRACCAFLGKNLSRSNCVFFYHVGIKHRHPLQRSAWHKIRANFKYLLAHSEALPRMSSGATTQDEGRAAEEIEMLEQRRNNLATIKYEHFEPLLSHDKLNVDNEESIWFAIKLWCNYNLAERANRVATLLACMRFPRFRRGTEFSANYIWRDSLVLNSAEAQHQLAVLDRNHRDFLTSNSWHSPHASGGGRRPKPSATTSSGFRDGFLLPCGQHPRQLRPRVPHSVLLAIGGWQQGQPTTLIESYDMNCNLWFESNKRIMSPLAYHGIECINGLLYICGGTDGREILNELFTFNPVNGESLQRPSMRESRCYVSTAHLEGHLYALGGHNGAQRMRSVERFDLANELWAPVADMNVARSDASACVHEGRIYIAGGLNDQIIESSCEFFNPRDSSWTSIASMAVPRTSFTLLAYRNNLLAIGGNNGSERLASVEQYDFCTRMWTAHSEMRHRRSTFSAALVEESKVIVVGGYNGQTPFNQVEMYDERQRSWLSLQRIHHDRSGLKVVVVSDLPNAQEFTFIGANSHASQGASRSSDD